MDISLLQPLVSVSRPWADLYNDSAVLQGGVLFTHFAGLLAAGGFAVASDRMALRASREPGPRRALLLRELAAVHRPVLIGLVVVTLTGAAMALADAEYLLTSWVFWLKMAAFGLLLGNGVLLMRAERRVRPAVAASREGPASTANPLALLSGTSQAPAIGAKAGADAPVAVDMVTADPDPGVQGPVPTAFGPDPERRWSALRWAAVRSMALWVLTLLLGTALTLA